MTSDEICEYYGNLGTKLTVRLLDNETILVEGGSDALRFLSELIASQAFGTEDGKCVGPNDAGSDLFTNNSTLGIYIHKLPCKDDGK